MACVSPLPAWRHPSGVVTLREPDRAQALRLLEGRSVTERRSYGYEVLHLPCGKCVGCRVSRAREWAVRCALEAQLHEESSFVTLTFDDRYVPPSIRKADLSGWVKRVRARIHPRTIRFFGCGEYGEQTHRPHYHALVFGLRESPSFQEAWPFGFVRVDPCTPATIAYVAGYVSKKFAPIKPAGEYLDESTGELYQYQPPFVLMSRRPGIGGHAREHWRSWRDSAIYHGQEVPVPRFLHEAFKKNATPEQLEQLESDKAAKRRILTEYGLEAAKRRLEARLSIKADQRRKL